MIYFVQTQKMMVKIKESLKKGKRFNLDGARICKLSNYAVSPKASKRPIQQAPTATKREKISKIAWKMVSCFSKLLLR